jgi:hypothetical protein
MKPQAWLLSTLAVVLVLAAGIIAANVYLDIYGIFRDPRGRRLSVYGDERVAKYLLSEWYVPANFNAVLIGSSVSANWRLEKIDQLRTYNDSLDGGNIVEEKQLVGQVLSRPGIQVAFLIVHPFLTHSHDFETVRLGPDEWKTALGSLSLWEAYKEEVRTARSVKRPLIDEFGAEEFEIDRKELNPTLRHMMSGIGDFEVDAIAFAEYRDVVSELHAHRMQTVFIIPPLEERLLAPKRAAFQHYLSAIRPMMTAQDKLIDFTSQEFGEFRADPRNFLDGVHLLHDGAAAVVSMINSRIDTWIKRGELRAPTRIS